MGGLARRVSYVKLFGERQKGVPALLVDAGNFLADERNYHGDLRPDVVAKDQWIFDAYDRFPVDVVNVSSHELRFALRLLRKADATKSAPIVDRLVSANAIAESPEFNSPRPYVVSEVPARGGAVRVAFIGLTEASPAPPRGFAIGDPAEAARRASESARSKADVVIAIARVAPDEAARIARQAPGLDVLIAAGANSVAEFFTPPRMVGNTQIVFGCFETRMLGELRFYREVNARFGTRVRYITLDDAVPDDPAGLELAKRAQMAEEDTRAASKKLLNDWLEQSRQLRPREQRSVSGYSGSASCGGCHPGQYIKWSSGRHAHATEALVQRPAEIDSSCFKCHASDRDEGRSPAVVQGVECERCHGPGAAHVAKPGPGYGRLSNLKSRFLDAGSRTSDSASRTSKPESDGPSVVRKLCSQCHSIDSGFELENALAKIKH